jgi:hypothetical protein
MGIYSSGKIFGIKIYDFNEDDVSNVLFEEKYPEQMTLEQMREAYLFYAELSNKPSIHFQYYTECSSTYGKGTFMAWQPISVGMFLENFVI